MLNSKEPSAFVKEPTLHQEERAEIGKIVACEGSSLPKTTPRADDVEVLTAWRSVTESPNFKVNFVLYFFFTVVDIVI